MSHDDIRAALEAATPGPWAYHADQHRDDGRVWRLGGDGDDICRLAYPDRMDDAHLIANAPTWLAELLAEVELVRTLKLRHEETIETLAARAEAAEQAIQRVRAIHYAADNDLARTPVCSNCEGKAGVHDCGCWADEDRQPVCGHCNEGWKGASVPWPCATVRALDGGEQHG